MSVFRTEKGDIYWRQHELEPFEVEYLKTMFREEAIAAWRADATAEYLDAQALLNDIIKAIAAQKLWWRMAGATA